MFCFVFSCNIFNWLFVWINILFGESILILFFSGVESVNCEYSNILL